MFISKRELILFALMGLALALVGLFQSPSVMLTIFNLCLISAIMALGVNIQWGYAGLFNAGVMGSAAIGGLVAVLVSQPPVAEAWQVGGMNMILSLIILLAVIALIIFINHLTISYKGLINFAIILGGYLILRLFFDQGSIDIEDVNPATYGYLGGLGLPIILSWLIAPFAAAGAAWIIGKISLGLKPDYLAIATLGISEIIVAMTKNEDWLTRGVKNVVGLDRTPVPLELELQGSPWFISLTQSLYGSTEHIQVFSSIFVKLCFALLFTLVLGIVLYLAMRALYSPWGRMMRAIRDNQDAAAAMGKDIVKRHLMVFIIGSGLIGLAGAMLTMLDGQFTPAAYQPLRFTFLIWVMVIVGGSGNNWGSVLGGFLVWFVWIESEIGGQWLASWSADTYGASHDITLWLKANAAYFRFFLMGVVLLAVLRFSPKGLLPER